MQQYNGTNYEDDTETSAVDNPFHSMFSNTDLYLYNKLISRNLASLHWSEVQD